MENLKINYRGEKYLFVDFAFHMEDAGTARKQNNRDYYSDSLEKQYQELFENYRIDNNRSLSEFIRICFPDSMPKRYYLSCPNFIREKQENKSGTTQYLNNLVLRPELTDSMKEILPPDLNVILIGDIVESELLSHFSVKGIEFIDSTMNSPHDVLFEGALHTKTDGRIFDKEASVSVLTPGVINFLIRECYTVANPAETRKFYDRWKDYFEKRLYCLQERERHGFAVNSFTLYPAFETDIRTLDQNPELKSALLDKRAEWLSSRQKSVYLDAEQMSDNIPERYLTRQLILKAEFIFTREQLRQADEAGNPIRRQIGKISREGTFSVNARLIKRPGNPETSLNFPIAAQILACEEQILPEEQLQTLDTEFQEQSRQTEARILSESCSGLLEPVRTYANEHFYDQALIKGCGVSLVRTMLEIFNGIKFSLNLDKFSQKGIISELENQLKNIFRSRSQQLAAAARDSFGSAVQNEKELNRRLDNFAVQYCKNFSDGFKRHITDQAIAGIKSKISSATAGLKSDFQNRRRQLIDELGQTCYCIYFRMEGEHLSRYAVTSYNGNRKISNLINSDKRYEFTGRLTLQENTFPEKIKIERQQNALDDFFKGYVKNPYLSTYLFSPSELQKPAVKSYSNWEWQLDGRLNEKQKDAVMKAVASNGLFLLQGPPGTGKTQVIAEIVSQLVRQGRKVLISSETHKAIDNVFERLPKRSDIVPIRLIPGIKQKKDLNYYEPEYLVDNFYGNICSTLKQSIDNFNNFNEMKNSFRDELKRLQLFNSRINGMQQEYQRGQDEIRRLEQQVSEKDLQNTSLYQRKAQLDEQMEHYRSFKNHLFAFTLTSVSPEFLSNPVAQKYIDSYRSLLGEITARGSLNRTEPEKLLQIINSTDLETVSAEIKEINPEDRTAVLEFEKNAIRKKMNACRDDFDDLLPGREEEFRQLKEQLRNIVNELNSSRGTETTEGAVTLRQIFSFDWMIHNKSAIVDEFLQVKSMLQTGVKKLADTVDFDSRTITASLQELNSSIDSVNAEIKQLQLAIRDISDSELSQTVQQGRRDLVIRINKFFSLFNINVNWNSVEEAFDIMQKEWDRIEKDSERTSARNRERIPMYKKIHEYLSSEQVVKQDKAEYTRQLFAAANVYGITCSSRENFKLGSPAAGGSRGGDSENEAELIDFGVDTFNLKKVGIDVVIIDEVSKSSFVDLLVPILYGKTVILVGDHRQLNPMYDLAKLRDEDYRIYDQEKFNSQINRAMTGLYEESFFKRLFEQIGDDFKIMLNQQYRCHESIMNVFNHFYNYELKLGYSGQNNDKRHNIQLDKDGIRIIRPDRNVYFVNCRGFESKRSEFDTSYKNDQEIEVVCKLMTMIDGFFTDEKNRDLPKLSIGVICTYGSQAQEIQRRIRAQKFNGYLKSREERIVVSTVDDFQGDERDIIILSMVRNSRNRNIKPEFIRNYQRINVALSRARRLLIITGNRDFLCRNGVIDLPDIHGRKELLKKNFPVYTNILRTIEQEGVILQAAELVPESNSSEPGQNKNADNGGLRKFNHNRNEKKRGADTVNTGDGDSR